MKALWVALVAGTLFLAGCRGTGTVPVTQPAAAVVPPEPAAELDGTLQPQEQVTPTAPASDKDQSREVATAEARTTPADSAAVTASGTDRDAPTESVSPAEVVAPVPAEPLSVTALVPTRTPESGEDKPVPWDHVSSAEPKAIAPVPAEPNDLATTLFKEYADILKTHVHEDGRVDYGALRRRRLDLKPLLMQLGELDPNAYRKWSRDEQLAFWINAYNLKMLDIITRNYPIQSSWWLRLTWPPDDIRHIRGMGTDFKFVVMDEELTLSEVEHRLFEKAFDDPRVYLALMYACQSSPILRAQRYRGEHLDRQLDDQVRQFLASPRGLQFDRRNMVVRLSALFKPAWRGKEFVRRYGTDKKFKNQDPETRAVLNFIAGYLSREDAYFLEVENYTLEFMNFDWRLNDTSRGY